jgi:hypothetical protein
VIPQSEQQCENCRFYFLEDDRCRRYAPRPVMGEEHDQEGGFFPIMFSDEWCGEWEPKAAP